MDDHFFMKKALAQARKAETQAEVPVGAILVHDNKIIAQAHNQVEMLRDATAHAEMLCLTMGSEALGNWRLLECTLYCTIEPCAMCLGAMFLSRIKRLVWGAPDLRHGANGSWVNLLEKSHPTHQIIITSSILAEECACIMHDFFKKRRDEKKGH